MAVAGTVAAAMETVDVVVVLRVTPAIDMARVTVEPTLEGMLAGLAGWVRVEAETATVVVATGRTVEERALPTAVKAPMVAVRARAEAIGRAMAAEAPVIVAATMVVMAAKQGKQVDKYWRDRGRAYDLLEGMRREVVEDYREASRILD